MRQVTFASSLLCFVVLGAPRVHRCHPVRRRIGNSPRRRLRLAIPFRAPGNSGGQISLTISGHNINGPRASLFSSGTKVRGTGNSGRSVDVSIVGNKANGLVGNVPFSCIVDIQPDGSAHIVGAMALAIRTTPLARKPSTDALALLLTASFGTVRSTRVR